MTTSPAAALKGAALFLGLWAFHLFAAGGALVPYRDTGEMVLQAHTLGVAHPPGYPFYGLLGKIAAEAGLGNTAYRVNVLSALAAALAGCALFLFLKRQTSPLTALAAVGLWATSLPFWELASVSEMYTAGFLALVLILTLLTVEKIPWPLVFFIWGLGLGLRTDLLLLAPAVLFMLWRRRAWPAIPAAALCGLAGFSIFFFMPLRSAQSPWLDWGDVEKMENFVNALLRKSHGGTLDFLSKSYASGENFISELSLFLKRLAGAFTWIGAPLLVCGAWAGWRRARERFLLCGVLFLVFGPLFLFWANLPPNPYAVAIVEAHDMPALLAALWLAAWGMEILFSGAWGRRLLGAVLVPLIVWNAWAHAPRGVKRWNLYARDYSVNFLRTAAPGSLGVAREDVQLFSFWERAGVARARPDVTVAAQGLAASPWYHAMMAAQNQRVALGPLQSAADWTRWVENNPGRALWISGEVNMAAGGPPAVSWGLPLYLRDLPAAAAATDPLRDFYIYRGNYRQTEAPDFFSSHLATEYALASLRQGSDALRARDWPRARDFFQRAGSLDPEAPSAATNLGFVFFSQGDYAKADPAYARASALYDDMLRRAETYNALRPVKAQLREDAAQVWVYRGVSAERQGRVDQSRQAYAQALRLNPRSAQAHYNYAVTHWNKDWNQVVRSLEEAVALEPQNSQYAMYLARARALREGKSP